MNEPTPTSPKASPAGKPPAQPAGKSFSLARLMSLLQFPLSILVAVGVLAYLLWPEGPKADEPADAAPAAEIVKLVGQHRLSITAGTALEKKLAVVAVVQQETSAPKLKVVGAVVARVPSEKHQEKDKAVAQGRWDFNTSDLASAYADWLKASADVPFYEKQLEDIHKLAEETLAAKKKVADRLEKLVKAGTDPQKDLDAAKADYRQALVQSQKDDHEAQTNLRNATRVLTTLERQLFQAGMDPELLANPTVNTAIVVAEVPESRIALAKVGELCSAQFSAFPGVVFPASVRSLAPTISKERRTLRVFFQLSDAENRLKPGMFAEIGLGTAVRKTLRIAAEGVLHVGRSDYVLVEAAQGEWKITEVKTGEQYGSQIEILDGLHAGDRVIGAGAILLKPYVVEDFQSTKDAGTSASAVGSGGKGK
jgi:membrane fusion protein, heavy metal efflux system